MDVSDTAPEARNVQWEIYRRMPPERKVRLIFDAYRTGQMLAVAGIRMRIPMLDEGQLWRIWARRHLGPELFDKVYGDSTNGGAAGNPGTA
ncbi:MAG: hypothetical protein ACYTBJ_20125 [Planctomycetota bacterium]|jgi:hypothetical protein